MKWSERKCVNIVIKHVLFAVTPIFIIYYEVDDVEGLVAAATKYLELLKQKDEAESSFIIEKIVGKQRRALNTRPFPLYLPLQNSNG